MDLSKLFYVFLAQNCRNSCIFPGNLFGKSTWVNYSTFCMSVNVGEEEGQKKVIHVTPASLWDGVMMATIKRDSINDIINPDDLGKKSDPLV